MGAILSRRKKKQSTEEILEDLQDKIEALEESKQTNIEKQKHLIGSLILYSIVLYVGAALLFYFYYMPESVSERITYASPLAVFPILGENRPGGWAFKPVADQPNRCLFCWIINTDLKGWIPQYAVDQALSGALLDFTKYVKKHIQELSISS